MRTKAPEILKMKRKEKKKRKTVTTCEQQSRAALMDFGSVQRVSGQTDVFDDRKKTCQPYLR